MIRFYYKFILSVCFLSGSLICKEVHQGPADVLCLPEQIVTLTCNHSIPNYYTILWYQRTHGDTNLELIAYITNTNPKYEANYEEKELSSVEFILLLLSHEFSSGHCIPLYQQEFNMITALVILALCLFSGQVDGNGVLQNPDIIWGSPGSSAEMNCTHNKDINHRQMYWFKQLPGEGITLLVFTSVGVKTDYGKFTEDKYVAVKTVVESGSLTVKNLEPGDDALYFCAVSQHCGANSLQH
ncbi:hypothetical protein Q7C36_011869 [Tachysurus vachellii]|uniref:Ig-like domain-containing protein n=1 Tax=Tachysurus vachellii TaxID=175792 RepID=A0AA88MSB1_TACVA|nr:hypothetical protein Q7C36_011869 [Tachysurus vachellii]